MFEAIHALIVAHPVEALLVSALVLWFGAGWASKNLL
jgi:hypothetical protein